MRSDDPNRNSIEARFKMILISSVYLHFLVSSTTTINTFLLNLINPTLPPQHPQGFSNHARTDCTRVDLENGIQQHQTRNENQDVSVLAPFPPALLHTDLPQAIDTRTSRVHERPSPGPSLEEGPKPTEKATPKPSLSGDERSREQELPQADAAPAGANGTGDEKCASQDTLGEIVELLGRFCDEGLVSWQSEEAEDEGEEFGEIGDSGRKESKVGAKTGWIVWV